jgi:hypothetical protein
MFGVSHVGVMEAMVSVFMGILLMNQPQGFEVTFDTSRELPQTPS